MTEAPRVDPRGSNGELELAKLPRAALLTIGLATLINLGLFFVFEAAGLITESVLISSPSGSEPLVASVVAVATMLGMVVGVLVFAAIIRLRGARAERTWRVVAAIVLVFSFAAPATIPGAPLGYVLALVAMHVVAGALAIWMLPTLTRE